ncbi:hypothetical protein KAR91_02360 [Candidatus Pacearchaeota archaeon]|nr:hypothetical protein [Candidatus Pacearchaeota archaeon]
MGLLEIIIFALFCIAAGSFFEIGEILTKIINGRLQRRKVFKIFRKSYTIAMDENKYLCPECSCINNDGNRSITEKDTVMCKKCSTYFTASDNEYKNNKGENNGN